MMADDAAATVDATSDRIPAALGFTDASETVQVHPIADPDADPFADAIPEMDDNDIGPVAVAVGSGGVLVTFSGGLFQSSEIAGYASIEDVSLYAIHAGNDETSPNNPFGTNTIVLVGLSTNGANGLEHIAGFQGEPGGSLKSSPSPVPPSLLQLEIDGANAAYARTVPAGATALDSTFLTALDKNTNGFFGMAYENNGVVFVAFEGTQFNLSAYGRELIAADVQILEGHWPAAFTDAILFALGAQSLAGSTPIYLTGHSLGGGEAEAVALFAAISPDLSIAGGVTFGAPGVPGYFGPSGFGKLTDFVDYGDPVGNYAHDGELAAVSLTGNHVGTVEFVGSPADAAVAVADLLSGNLPDAFQFHELSHYAADLGLTIDNSANAAVANASAAVANQIHAEAITHHTDAADAPIPHFDAGAAHLHHFLI